MTIKGGSLNLVTKNPLNHPAKVPTNKPIAKAAIAGSPSPSTYGSPITVFAITIDANIAIAPHERSIPAVRIISV